MVNSYVPDQGDIIFANFSPQSGKEQSGRRPGLVLTPALYNKRSNLLICCPITSKQKGYEFEVQLSTNLQTKGVVLSDHVRSIDWKARNTKFQEKADTRTLTTVLKDIHQLTQF